jgi:hypothetical protein
VPSRERNWHDLFNALTWLAFPATKAALNAVHQTTLLPGLQSFARVGRRHLFDESGLVLAGEDDRLANCWPRAMAGSLGDRRDDWKNIGCMSSAMRCWKNCSTLGRASPPNACSSTDPGGCHA